MTNVAYKNISLKQGLSGLLGFTPHFILAGIALLMFFMPEIVFAKDFASGIRQAETKISDILMVLGPVALAVAAGAFHFSKQMGTNLLLSAVIGIILFASAPSLFSIVYNTFR